MVAIDGTAAEHADRGATEWRATVHALKRATSDHSGFYVLAAELVDTLRSLGSLAGVLARQVHGYDVGCDLYDDSGTIDARERLDLAAHELQDLVSVLDRASRHARQFHSDIGHIGGGPADSGDRR